jgi:hypothetical protein
MSQVNSSSPQAGTENEDGEIRVGLFPLLIGVIGMAMFALLVARAFEAIDPIAVGSALAAVWAAVKMISKLFKTQSKRDLAFLWLGAAGYLAGFLVAYFTPEIRSIAASLSTAL